MTQCSSTFFSGVNIFFVIGFITASYFGFY